MENRILESVVQFLCSAPPLTVWGHNDGDPLPLQDVALLSIFGPDDQVIGFQVWSPPPGGYRGYFNIRDILALNVKDREKEAIWVTVSTIQNRRD